jgi:hypothetical protein
MVAAPWSVLTIVGKGGSLPRFNLLTFLLSANNTTDFNLPTFVALFEELEAFHEMVLGHVRV